MFVFPISEMLDDAACLAWLERYLHPSGLRCPRCQSTKRRDFRMYQAFPSYRCRDCQRSYTLVTGTAFKQTRQRPATVVLLLRGITQGVRTAQLAEELARFYQQTHTLRQRVQDTMNETAPQRHMQGTHFESDAVYQHAGGGEATPIPTPTTRRGGAAITVLEAARTRTTARRSSKSSVGKPARYACGCSIPRTRKAARACCKRCCHRMRPAPATNRRAIRAGRHTSRSATPRTSRRVTTTAMAYAKSTATPARVRIPAYEPSCAPSEVCIKPISPAPSPSTRPSATPSGSLPKWSSASALERACTLA